MNLLMISLHADPTSPAGIGEGGGTHSYVRELLTYFSTKDIKILFITRKSHPNLPESELISENCIIQRIIIKDEYPIDKKELYTFHNISLSKTEAILDKTGFNPDLIHSIYWNSGQLAKELSKKWGIPFVHTVISNGLRRQNAGMKEILEKRFEVERDIFESAAYIFSITPSERQDLVELYQINASKIIVLGRPISKDFLYPSHDDFGIPYRFAMDKKNISKISESKLDISLKHELRTDSWWRKQAFLYCGRLASNKGVDIVLKAWYRLKTTYQNICPSLWIVGGSLHEIELIKSKLENDYDFEYYEKCGDLVWWGYLDQRGISTLMLKSHALIMHSSYEPGGRVIIEALASGIPVIASLCGFGENYIFNWYNGFQVPFGNIELLSHTMSLFVKQPYLTNCLGINARKYMQKMLMEWDFYKIHQSVYTLASANIVQNFQYSGVIKPCQKNKDYINVYPYFNDIIPIDTLNLLLQKELNENCFEIVTIYTESAAIWNAKTPLTEYEVWQPYTKILDKQYYNPFSDIIVDKRGNQYEREKYAVNLKINPVLKFIDSYYIYIKKKFSVLSSQDLSKKTVQVAIKSLFDSFLPQSLTKIKNILQIFDRNWDDYSTQDIKKIYNEYYRLVPSFLYHSDHINLKLSIRQLEIILNDKNSMFSSKLLSFYSECENFLKHNNSFDNTICGICIDDCSVDNIVFDKKQLECMFKNASTIYWGDTSYMCADFIHSYLLIMKKENKKIDFTDKYLDLFLGELGKQNIIKWLFIVVLEKLVLYLNMMNDEKYKKELELFVILKETYVYDKKTS